MKFDNCNSHELGQSEHFSFEGEETDKDPNMFVLKTYEISKKQTGMLGTKRRAEAVIQKGFFPNKVRKILHLNPK